MRHLTLTNSFHNSQVAIHCHVTHTEDRTYAHLGERQYREACRRLCGIAACECGGIRGPQYDAACDRPITVCRSGDE